MEYNVLDYGAAGSGLVDDTAGVQAALDAANSAGGGTVIIPSGVYLISDFLVVRSDTTITASGATLRAVGDTGLLRSFAATDSFAGYGGNSRIRVFGGIWDGNAGDGSDDTTTATTNVMGFIHGRDILVRDATIRNVSSAHGIELNAIDGGRVIGCRFEGFRDNSGDDSRQFSEAIQIDVTASPGSSSIPLYDDTPSRNVLVQGCYMGAAVDGSGHGPFGKLVGSHTAPAGVMYEGIRVIGCLVDGALDIAIRAYSWRRSVIAGNVIVNAASHGIAHDTADDQLGSTIIADNTIVDAGGSGIVVNGASGLLTTNTRITGNIVSSAELAAISCQYCDEPSVVGNSVRGGGITGIFFQHGVGGQITGNTVVDTGSNCLNVTSQDGVLISGNRAKSPAANYLVNIQTATDCEITGNHLSDPVNHFAILNLTSATQKNFVHGNTMRKGATGSAYVVRSNSTNGLKNYVINNDCKGFSDAVPYYGVSGQTNGFEWNTGSAGTPKGTVQKTFPATTNAGTNLAA